MHIINEKTIIVRRTETLSATVDNEAVVLGIESGNYFGLNEIGSEIWNRIADPVSVKALISALSDKYTGDTESIRKDILDFLSTLHEKGLIRIVDEADS